MGPDGFDDERLHSPGAQIEARNAAGDCRAEHLIEHDAPALMLVLERKERAVRKDAHTEPGAIGNSHQAKIAVMRCCEPADIGGAHRLLLICRPPADKERDRPQLSTQTRARLSRLPTDRVS